MVRRVKCITWQPSARTQTGVGVPLRETLPGGPTQTAEDMSRDMRQIRNQPEGPSATSPSWLPHLPRQARWPQILPPTGRAPSPPLPRPTPPLPSQILPEQGLLWQPSPKYSSPSGRAEEAEEPKVTESNPGYCCLRLARVAACHWLCLMRRCGSRAPPPAAVREAGTRAQSQGPGSLGAPASCAGKAGSPVPWP